MDVHKDMVFCAIYDGKDAIVKKFDTFTPDLEEMCDCVLSLGVDVVAMESTGIQFERLLSLKARQFQARLPA